jgi:hypothetical protein
MMPSVFFKLYREDKASFAQSLRHSATLLRRGVPLVLSSLTEP